MQSDGSSISTPDCSAPAIVSALDTALHHHMAGDLARAESQYRQILSQHPDHADALHLLGMVHHQTDRTDEAERLIRQAISISPNQSVYHSNLGLVLTAGGKTDAAIEAYRTAILSNPSSAVALNNLAVALCESKQTDEAAKLLRQAILLQPDYADARRNLLHLLGVPLQSVKASHALGDLFQEGRQSAEAVKYYRQAIDLDPQSAETHNNLGNALFAQGDREQALACYQQAISLRPDFPQACNNLANLLIEAGQVKEAMAAYGKAIQLQPDSAEPLSNLGNLLREDGQWESAMQLYYRALVIDADHAPTRNNIGNAWCERGQWSRAIDSYEHALSINPSYADAINNLGTALEEIGDRQRAMQCYRKSMELDPDAVSPPWNIALLQLLQGDYPNGWRGYEHRWRQKKQSRSKRDFAQPMPVNLEELKGRRILLHSEQGFGDAIQFCRYATMVARYGADVILECPAALVRLFCTSFNSHPDTNSVAISVASRPGPAGRTGAVTVVARGQPLPALDLQCPLMSLPMLFGTTLATVPADVPYLSVDLSLIEKWKSRLADQGSAHRVGLVWAGQSTHQKDQHRSLSLADFAGLAQVDGVHFYSLQVGGPASQSTSPPPGMQLVDWTADLQDFADTAALINQLDLVITVDTAVGHLAGALGKPVWILLAFQPDWRWLLNRDDSPWYPNARLFRQRQPDDWTDVVARIQGALFDWRKLAGIKR